MAPPLAKKILSIQNPKSIIGSWIFTIIWCGIAFTVFFVFAFKARDVFGGIIGGFFSLLGFVMIYMSIKMTLEYFKYEAVQLTLQGEPAVGGKLRALLELPAQATPRGMISAELACVKVRWMRDSEGDTSKSESDLWTHKRVVPVRVKLDGGTAALDFDIPADKPATDAVGEPKPDAMIVGGYAPAGVKIGRDYYRWEMRVTTDVPGVDFERTYRIDVAPGAQTATESAQTAALPARTSTSSAQPGPAPAARPPSDAVADVVKGQQRAARRMAGKRLSAVAGFVAAAPFVAPFAIMGIAVGLAGCPMGWSKSEPPRCEFAGIDWGPLMAGAFDLMSIAIPAGMVCAAMIYYAGKMWLDRRELMNPAAGAKRFTLPVIGVIVVGLIAIEFWPVTNSFRSSRSIPPPVEEKAPSRVQPVAGYEIQPDPGVRHVMIAGRGIRAEASGSTLRIRLDEIRLETHPDQESARYEGMHIEVYRSQSGQLQTIGFNSDLQVRGTLTRDHRVATLKNMNFLVRDSAQVCSRGECQLKLQLSVKTPGYVSLEGTVPAGFIVEKP